ncbi:hypothetical protein [Variovorax sp. TBS-050B]|uniref:hypothetical protein n=1 Tax=Variovorax sp. TBS-050B TaxID=2940551 RepID=UPI0024753C8C|nr:hypothetical protein [Variovorax sp. TBS-050B]
MEDRLTVWFRSGGAFRSRGVGPRVPRAVLDVPALSARLVADWENEMATNLFLEPGDVEPLPLARARSRWPAHRQCLLAMADWLATLGMPGVLDDSELALMACRGARYHHDAAQYGGAAFCNLFVSEDKGLEVHFPGTGERIPLVRGTAFVFDTAQPHAVIRRGSGGFDAGDFAAGQDRAQFFLSWELPIEHAAVARALGIAFDTTPAAQLGEAQVMANGARVRVCADSGRWRPAD